MGNLRYFLFRVIFIYAFCRSAAEKADIHECFSGPCKNGGSCADNVNGYNCTCEQGYTGINCETDINECASGPCQNGGSCADIEDGYNCTCQQGYTGNTCETDINECASEPCGNAGSCADSENGYNCTCEQGYTGINCETDINECTSGPCQNGGTCADSENGYNCTCQQGYTGNTCETDINECASGPCKNGGSCANNVNGYNCNCQQGYEGINCEIDINECASKPCQNGGSCADNVIGYTCSCRQGYTGINCETDINECASEPCRNGGLCADKVNGYNCSCQQGYTGINCQTGVHCDPIGKLYGGDVIYENDNREVGTFAYYTCDDDFSIYPEVYNSSCLANRTWFPEPPKCYKKANAECPTNSDCNGSFVLLHKQTKTIRCDKEFELFDVDNDEFFDKKAIHIKNSNGTLKPAVPICVGKRCNSAILTHAVIKYANGSHADNMVRSGRENLQVSCEDGYELDSDKYREKHKLSESICCLQGEFYKNCNNGEYRRVTTCIEKSCPIKGYPNNLHTKRQREGEFSRFLADDEYISHGETIKYSCQNKDYELYVQETDEYLTEFSETCHYGNFSRPKQEFPVCQERGCEFPLSERDENACYFVSNTSSACSNDTFKIASGSKFSLKCTEGFELYQNTNQAYIQEEWATLTCVKGKPTPEYLCKPKRCMLPSMPSNATRRMSKPISSIKSSHVESGESVELSCQRDFELFVESTNTYLPNFQSTCLHGNFGKKLAEFPNCIEKRCEFRPISGVKYYKNDIANPESNRALAVESGSSINISCNPGFKLYSKRTTNDSREEIATVGCIKGKLEYDVRCLPDQLWSTIYTQVKVLFFRYEDTMSKFACRFSLLNSLPCADSCFVPEIQHGWMKPKSSHYAVRSDVNHDTMVQVKCEEGYQLVGSPELQCINGEWNKEIPVCWYKPCELDFVQGQLVLDKANNIISTPGEHKKFPNGTQLIMRCLPGYSVNIVTDGVHQEDRNVTRVTSVCQSGSWMPLYTCSPKRCVLPSMPSNATTRMSKAISSINSSHVESGKSVELSCQSDFELFVESTNTYLPNFWSTCLQGNFDRNITEFPNCIEKRCVFRRVPGVKYYTNDKDNPELESAFTVESRSSVNITCNPGFKLFSNTTTNDSREETATVGCIKGKLEEDVACLPDKLWRMINTQVNKLFFRYEDTMSKFACRFSLISSPPYADSCFVPEIQHGRMTQFSSDAVKTDVKHETMVLVKCDEEYQLIGSAELQCINGEWNNELPVCWYRPCDFDFVQGQLVLDKGNNIISTPGQQKKFPNGTQLIIECISGYSLNIRTANGYQDETNVSTVTTVCQSGSWMPLYKCLPKPCEINFVRGQLVLNENNNIISNPGLQKTFQNGTKLNITCLTGHSLFKLDNERLEETNVSTAESVCQTGSWKPDYQCFKDCKLSDDDSLRYKTLDGGDVGPGSFIKHGAGLQVYCRYIDLGDYTYTYVSEDDNNVPQVECSNGTIGQINITCKQGDPATCKTLANGYVERRFLNEYKVSCNEGYALNLMRPDLPYCECQGDKLVCQYGGQTPKCEPEPCTIPYSYDDRLSIFIRRGGSVVSLSGGVTVNVGETLFFNCINTEFENFEPSNRRFKCKNGKWLEDEKDKEWKLGYNGEFPLCRNTSCVPMCKNGGKCIRDGKCQCPHLTSGATCEDVLCDAECKKNGGICIAPGKCGMCPKGKYGNNCEHRECTLPTDGPKVKNKKSSYQIGDKISSSDFVCAVGQKATPETGITCLEWGNWSETAHCISGCKPPVGMPEVKNNSKTFYNEGDKISSSNLFCPGGHVLFPKDDKICLNGGIWTDTAKCQKGCYPPDDTPPMEKHKDFYQIGEVIASANFECSSGTFTSPSNGMTCLQSEKWSETIKCFPGCKLPDDIHVLLMNQQQKLFYGIGEHIPSSAFRCSLPSVLSSENGMICKEKGLWNEVVQCISRCSHPVNAPPLRTHKQKQFYNTGESIASSEFQCDGRLFAMPENGMTCKEGGNWTEPVKCIEDRANCYLPSDNTFLYKTTDGVQINTESFIRNGTKVDVSCQHIELDYDYSAYLDETIADDSVLQIECLNGRLGQISLKCKTVPENCTSLANGSVKRITGFNAYNVSCNEGYALNLILPDKPYCECRVDKLVCEYGGQTPECKPVPCEIPKTFDNRLKIHTVEGNIGLTGGIVVDIGDIVIFNCTNTDVQYFEPNNRRFKCENGKWLEAETDWAFGNNREFPTCRNTTCEPHCTNGGKCIRDDTCECPHHTSGKRCEKVGCKSPHNTAPLKDPKPYYTVGDTIPASNFTCGSPSTALPENGMTCLEGGSWTETVTCKTIPIVMYTILLETKYQFTGRTNTPVYIILHGDRLSTGKIYLPQNNLNETQRFARDVTPIRRVTVGQDDGLQLAERLIDSISVIVFQHDQYYNFEQDKNLGSVWRLNGCIQTLEPIYWTWPLKYERSKDKRDKRTDYFYIGESMTENYCKQQCFVYRKRACNSVYYLLNQHSICYGFEDTDKRDFKVDFELKTATYFRRTCMRL